MKMIDFEISEFDELCEKIVGYISDNFGKMSGCLYKCGGYLLVTNTKKMLKELGYKSFKLESLSNRITIYIDKKDDNEMVSTIVLDSKYWKRGLKIKRGIINDSKV